MVNDALDQHIINIIQKNQIFEQIDLQKILQNNGFEIPQATLSRRLKKLNIAKVAGIYKAVELYKPALPLILNLQVSDFGLIVLHTSPGQANSLAYFFDQKYVNYSANSAKNSGILGTIAGDDTVLLIIQSNVALANILNAIAQDFPYLTTSII